MSTRVKARIRSRARAAGTLTGACAAALSLAACISPPPQPSTPNDIQYQGPQSVPGPSGTFSFSFTQLSGGTPQISVAAPQGMTCTLVGTTQVTYARAQGFVSSRSYCMLTADSDSGGQYIGQSMTVTVNVSAASATASASPGGTAVSPSSSATGAAVPPQPAPAAPSQAAPAAPAPTPAVSRSTSATPSASKSASASATAASTAPAGPSTAALLTQTVTWNPTTAISSTTPSSDGGREFKPSAQATTSGNGAITYTIGSPSTSQCHMRQNLYVVVGQNGSCTVIATAAATSTHAQGSASVTFTITNYTDPNPPPPPSPTAIYTPPVI